MRCKGSALFPTMQVFYVFFLKNFFLVTVQRILVTTKHPMVKRFRKSNKSRLRREPTVTVRKARESKSFKSLQFKQIAVTVQRIIFLSRLRREIFQIFTNQTNCYGEKI